MRRLAQHVDAVGGAAQGVELVADGALREPHDGRPVVDGDRLAELFAQTGRVARGGDPDAGDDLQDRQIPHAVVARAVRAGDAGPVEHEGDARACSATSISTWSNARLMKVA